MDDAGQDVVNSITDTFMGAYGRKVNDLADKIPSFGVEACV